MGPLDSSAGVPEESGVRRPLVSHHSMELTAHPFPAPRGLLPEAEQLLRERLFFHCRKYQLLLHLIFPHLNYKGEVRKGLLVSKALVIALLILVIVIVSLLIARF